MKVPARVFTAAYVAERRGTSVQAARRWLWSLEELHGPGLVQRVGSGPNSRLTITAAALRKVDPSLLDDSERAACDTDLLEELREVIDRLRAALSDVERRQRSQAARLAALERGRKSTS